MSRYPVIILILVLAVYGFLTVFPPGGLMAYVIPSSCWIVIALVTLKFCGFKRIRSWFDKRTAILALLVATFQMFILIDAGLFTGFGTTPASLTPIGIINNAVLVFSVLIGTELSRAYLIKSYAKKKPLFALGLVAVLYSFMTTSILGLLGLNEPLIIAEFLGTGLLPAIAENLLASYLALLSGPIASIAYRAPLLAFQWFSPILPDLPWGFEALIGVMAPTLGFAAISIITTPRTLRKAGIRIPRKKTGRNLKHRRSSPRGWVILSIICVLIVWSATGLLGFYPTVIVSGSMRPTMDVGDIAMIVQTFTDDIKPGDIIQYIREGEMDVHRVVDVQEAEGEKLFITQGDANPEPDWDPVHPSQIRGKLILIIPKLGWAPIAVKTSIGNIWAFFSANAILAYATLATALAASIYKVHAYRSRPARKWRRLNRKRGWLRK